MRKRFSYLSIIRYCLVVFIAIFAITLSSTAMSDNSVFDVRAVRWGMSVEDVQKSETSEFVMQEGDNIYYQTELMDKKCDVIYKFKENALVEVIFKIDVATPAEGRLVYATLVGTLQEKYAEERDNPLRHIMRKYSNERTIITLSNFSKGDNGCIFLTYKSQKYSIEKQKEQDRQDELKQEQYKKELSQF